MKHTKKLIPAIGMLLLSACMLVTSTFAWFSMNTTVKATGMSVSAKGDQVYLQIINASDSFDSSLAQISATAVNQRGVDLKPTSVAAAIATGDNGAQSLTAFAGGKDFIWVDAASATVDAWQAANGYTTLDKSTLVTNKYVLHNTFKIRLNKEAGKETATAPLKASSVAFSSTYSDNFAKCVSVLVVCGNYSTLFKQNAEGEFEASGDTDLTGGTIFADITTTGTQVDVYVFFDGENSNCKISELNTSATINAAGYAVDVFFTCA